MGYERSCVLVYQARRVRGHVLVLGVSSQDSEWSCICVLGYQARTVSGHVFVIKPGQ